MNRKTEIDGTLFEIRRNPRRTHVSIGTENKKDFYISIPEKMSEAELKKLLTGKIEGILKKLVKKSGATETHKYEEGEKFLLEGREYPLIYDRQSSHTYIKFTGNEFLVSASDKETVRTLFEKFYAQFLRSRLKKIMPCYTQKTLTKPERITVKKVKTLWGSCSSNKSLTFSLRLAMVEPKLLEYVIIHELSHMKEMNHSPAFWREVEKHVPDYAERRHRLKEDTLKYML